MFPNMVGWNTDLPPSKPKVEPETVAPTETIQAAAIRHNGTVYTGFDHAEAYANAPKDVSQAEQGFTTSTGRFVDRSEAYDIATKTGQIKPDGGDRSLMSEMLPGHEEAYARQLGAKPPAIPAEPVVDEPTPTEPDPPEVDWHRPIEPGEEIELPPPDLTGHRTDLPPQRCKLCARPYKPGYLLQVNQGGFCWTCKRRRADEVPTDRVWKGNLRAEWEEFERYVRQAQLELCDTDLDKEQDFSFGDYGIIRCTERVRRAAMLYGIDMDPRYIEGKTKVPIWKLLALNAGEDTPSKFPHMVQYFTEKHVLLGRSRRLREMRRIDPPKDPSKLVDYNIELGKLEDAILKMRPKNPIETAAQQSAIRDMLPSNKTVLEFTKEAAGRALRYQLSLEPKR